MKQPSQLRRPAPRRVLAEGRGRKGEDEAARHLESAGWRILDRRVKTPAGEVDIVARHGETVVFVEVKWRARAADLDFAIDEYRLRRVAAAAEILAATYAADGGDIRVDVLLLAPGAPPTHIENAWMP